MRDARGRAVRLWGSLGRLSWLWVSGAAQVSVAAFGLLTNLLLARSLSLELVGKIAVANSIAMIGSLLLDRGVGTWATQALGSGRISGPQGLCMLLRAGMPGLAIVFTCVLVSEYSGFGQPLFSDWLILATAFLLVSYWLFTVALSLAQGLRRARERAIALVLNACATLILVALSLVMDASADVVVVMSGVGYLVAGIWLATRCVGLSFRPPRASWKRIPFLATAPLLVTNTLTFLVGFGDVLIVGAAVGVEDVARFQIAKKCAQVVALPLISSIPVFLGRSAGQSANSRVREFRRFISVAGAIFVLGGVGVRLWGSEIVEAVFGVLYRGLGPAVGLLLCAFFYQFSRDTLSAGLIVMGRFWRSGLGPVVSVVMLGLGQYIIRSLGGGLLAVCVLMVVVFLFGFLSLFGAVGDSVEKGLPSLSWLAAMSVGVGIVMIGAVLLGNDGATFQ